MKKAWIGFGTLLFLIILYKALFGVGDPLGTAVQRTSLDGKDQVFHQSSVLSESEPADDADNKEENKKEALDVLEGKYTTKADSVVAFALQRYGAEYSYGGVTEEGFDCSGFTTYVYGKFRVDIPHGSSLQASQGTPIPLDQAKKGDLLIFTGTNLHDRTPGHVGIVITNPPKAVQFVHSSSNGGVKVSSVEGTLYQKRFLDARRVIK